MPYPLAVAAPAVTAVKVLAGLSTSVSIKVPVAVCVPAIALATPLASVTAPVLAPVITAASLVPLMVIFTAPAVPSMLVTAKVSLTF